MSSAGFGWPLPTELPSMLAIEGKAGSDVLQEDGSAGGPVAFPLPTP
jgi:hypothetical protein